MVVRDASDQHIKWTSGKRTRQARSDPPVRPVRNQGHCRAWQGPRQLVGGSGPYKVVNQIQEARNGVPGPWFVIRVQGPNEEGKLITAHGHPDEVWYTAIRPGVRSPEGLQALLQEYDAEPRPSNVSEA
eukprot:176952-Heterocapsa_arctica.AAC.1